MKTYNYETQLRQVAIMIGANDFLGQQGLMLLDTVNRFIKARYSIKPEELLEAFELACARRLHHAGRPLDPDTFGKTLHSNLVGKILSSYLAHKKEIENSKAVSFGEPIKRITPFEAYELCLKCFKEEGELINAPVNMAYEYLLEKGQVKKIEVVKTNRFQDNFDGSKHRSVVNYLTQLTK